MALPYLFSYIFFRIRIRIQILRIRICWTEKATRGGGGGIGARSLFHFRSIQYQSHSNSYVSYEDQSIKQSGRLVLNLIKTPKQNNQKLKTKILGRSGLSEIGSNILPSGLTSHGGGQTGWPSGRTSHTGGQTSSTMNSEISPKNQNTNWSNF